MRTFSQQEHQDSDNTPVISLEEHMGVYGVHVKPIESLKDKIGLGSPNRKME